MPPDRWPISWEASCRGSPRTRSTWRRSCRRPGSSRGWAGTRSPLTLYDRLLPHRHRFVVEGIGAYVHGSVERFLGLLAGVLGRPERTAHFAAAREQAMAAGAGLLVRLVDAESGVRVAPRRVGPIGACSGAPATGGPSPSTAPRSICGTARACRIWPRWCRRPGVDVAALQLAGRAEPATRGEAMLDDQARAAYRKRLSAIDDEIADAEADADLGRLEKARVEREFLIAELTQAAGLGGRARRMGDDVERARTAVTARVRDADPPHRAREPGVWASTSGDRCAPARTAATTRPTTCTGSCDRGSHTVRRDRTPPG